MSGADATGLPGDAGPGRRAALLIAVETYADQSLAELRAPADDAAAFRDVLSDSALGGFEVTSVIDADAQQIRLAVDEFLTACKPEDLALVYLSCHGLMDARRRLYFAATDTLKDRLAPTGVGGIGCSTSWRSAGRDDRWSSWTVASAALSALEEKVQRICGWGIGSSDRDEAGSS